MIRGIISFVIITAFLSSCSNSGKTSDSSQSVAPDASVKVEFASLIENTDSYIDKNITVEGKVVHVCTMTGKKLFIVGEDPDITLFITAGENISKFPMELLGSEVVVEGMITRVAGAITGEGMTVMEGSMGTMSADTCETESALSAQIALADVVMEYKSHSVK